LVYYPRQFSPGFYESSLTQVYGSITPNIVRVEPNEDRMLMAVAEGAGITLLLAGRTNTLRVAGVVYRRFTDPEPAGAVALAFHRPPSLPARRFIDLAVQMSPRKLDESDQVQS